MNKHSNELEYVELFSGYGTPSFALDKLKIQKKLVGYSDIDNYANQCFRQNHYGPREKCMSCSEMKDGVIWRNKWQEHQCGQCFNESDTSKELGDVTKIDPDDLEDFNLLTAGFPCQAFSIAGERKGVLDKRGILFLHIIRVAEAKKPNYMLLENVKGLVNWRISEKDYQSLDEPAKEELHDLLGNIFVGYDLFKAGEFLRYCLDSLKRIGYHVHWKVLNTKDYGVPQNRDRVWFVCFRDYFEWKKFKFPEKEVLEIFLKDILEKNVDKKYYLSKEQSEKLLSSNVSSFRSRNVIKGDVCQTLQAAMSHGNTIPLIVQVNNPKHSNDRVYGVNGISPTLNTMQGGNRQPFIIQRHHGSNKGGIRALDGVVPAITSSFWEHNNYLAYDYTIRKLTPKECFRLQGFLDDEVNLEGLSNTQQYKLAGNGQSVNVVAKILRNMFRGSSFDTSMQTEKKE